MRVALTQRLREIIFLAFFCCSLILSAQNIVPNPDFEFFTSCPTGFGQGGPLEGAPWQSGSAGTSDYFHECSAPNFVGVPLNFFGSQPAHSGSAYGGFFARYNQFEYREYLQTVLSEPMDVNFSYLITMYISLADNYCGITNLGIYISNVPPVWNGITPIPVTPQVLFPQMISETNEWVLLQYCYVPTGGEQYITIGNYNDDLETQLDPTCQQGASSYYYLDDVFVEKGGPPGQIDLELGDEVYACYSYEIDPDVDDVNYHWEDGSIGETLVVTESGTYTLTVTSGCSIGIDSVEVIISGNAPVEIGPAATVFCEGESYDIELDPDLGDYTWQDGSNDTDYTITESGLYSVSLDDGCAVSTDEVLVTVVALPEPFTLGADTYLCEGDEIEYNFDPDLGDFTWQNNSHSNSYTITDGGIYSLTISNECGEVVADIEIEALGVPEFSLGPDEQDLCDGDFIDLEFDQDLGSFVWQDGSTDNFYSISDPGLYSLTITNLCGPNSADINVTVVYEPSFDLGQDIYLCSGELPVTLSVVNVLYAESYTWQDGSLDPTYEVQTAGAYSVTVYNSCFSVSDDLEVVTQNIPPLIQLPFDQTLCAGQTLTLTGNGVTGNYVWQDGSTNTDFLVSAPGTYSVTVTDDCGVGIDQVTIDYLSPLANPDLGADVLVCPGELYTFYANTPGVNYSWQNGTIADSLNVTSSGTYWLQISDMCSSASDTVNVIIDNTPPAVDLPTTLPLCDGETVLIESGISGVTFLWSDGSSAPSLSVSTPGVYGLTVSNSCGTANDNVQVIDLGPLPSVDLGQDTSLCPADVFHLQPISANVISWLWQNGSTNADITISSPGQVIAFVTNDCGVVSDTIDITGLADVASLDLGQDTTLCNGESFTLTISLPDVSIAWSNGSITPNFLIDTSGLFYATIANTCGSSSDSILVTLLPDIPLLDLGIDQPLCPGETIIINPGIADVDYLWHDGSGLPTFTTSVSGNIILTISNECGSSTDAMTIFDDATEPQIELGPDVIACDGDVISLEAGIGGVVYEWQDGSTNPDYLVSVSGLYILEVTNACGSDIDSVLVTISGTIPNPALGPDTSLCEGNTMVLTSDADAFTTILWQDGSALAQFPVIQPGEYYLSETNHCGAGADTIVVSYVNAPAAFNLGSDTVLCNGESLTLVAPSTNDMIVWHDGSNALTFVADAAQIYSLTISNDCGTASDELVLEIDSHTSVINLDPMISICEGDIITLDATQDFSAQYIWSNGSVLPTLSVNTPGTYAVTISTDCTSDDQEAEIVFGTDCILFNNLYVPDVFSPNGDNVNDVFTIIPGSDLELTAITCSIFDRWGTLVYESKTLPVSWDGSFQGNYLNPAVFTYFMQLEYLHRGDMRSEVKSGSLTLVR